MKSKAVGLTSTAKRSKPRCKYNEYSRETLQTAVKAIQSGTLTVTQAKRTYKVPRTTIMNHLKGKHTKLQGAETILNEREEALLVNWIIDNAKAGNLKTTKEIKAAAGELTIADGRKGKKFKNGLPNGGWMKYFLIRHPEVSKEKLSNLASSNADESDLKEWQREIGSYLAKEGAVSQVELRPNAKRQRDCVKSPISVESAIVQFFLHAGIPFEIVESEQWKQLLKILNPSYAATMPKASELERKFSGGICLVCHSPACNNFSQNQSEQVFIKIEPELDCDLEVDSPSSSCWTAPVNAKPVSMDESEDEALVGHMKTHATANDEKNLRCATCDKICLTEARLEFHKLTDHEKQTSAFVCPVCSESDLWNDIADFRTHFLEHRENETLCTICGTRLKKGSLYQHMIMHSNIKLFVCEFGCNKSFRDAGKRRVHHRVHTGEKKFSCPICPDKRYAQYYGRNLHMKKYHSSEKDQKVSCQICGVNIASKSLLKLHLAKAHQVVDSEVER